MMWRIKRTYKVVKGEAKFYYLAQVKKWYGWVTFHKYGSFDEAKLLLNVLFGNVTPKTEEDWLELEKDRDKWMQQACYWEQRYEILREEAKLCANCDNGDSDGNKVECKVFGGEVNPLSHCEMHRCAPRCLDCMNFTPTSSMVGVCSHFGEEVTPSSSCENIRLK